MQEYHPLWESEKGGYLEIVSSKYGHHELILVEMLILVESLLCARPCAKRWKYNDEPNKFPTLVESTF